MTKSTITREQLLEIIETDHVQCGEASYLARMALAAMDGEPVAYLVCNGRLYQDRPFLSLSAARISVNDRNDGAEIRALCVIETLTESAE